MTGAVPNTLRGWPSRPPPLLSAIPTFRPCYALKISERSFLQLFALCERIYIPAQRNHAVVYSLCVIALALPCPFHYLCRTPSLFDILPIFFNLTKVHKMASNAVQSFPPPCRVVTNRASRMQSQIYLNFAEAMPIDGRAQVAPLQRCTISVYKSCFSHISHLSHIVLS